MDDFEARAYPDTFTVGGQNLKGSRDRKTSEVHVPYTDEPQVSIGDVIQQRSGQSIIELKVLDVDFVEGGSLDIGTSHPHMLTLHVENLSSAVHRAATQAASVTSNFNIGTLNGQQVQLGNHNTQVNNISLAEVVKQVAEGTDVEAKSLVRKLLENNTVAALVGAGVPALIGLLAG